MPLQWNGILTYVLFITYISANNLSSTADAEQRDIKETSTAPHVIHVKSQDDLLTQGFNDERTSNPITTSTTLDNYDDKVRNIYYLCIVLGLPCHAIKQYEIPIQMI